MNPDNEILDAEATVENIVEEPVVEVKPKKAKTKITENNEDIEVSVLFTKKVVCAGKLRNIHDIGLVLQSELDKLPEKSYLVRKK